MVKRFLFGIFAIIASTTQVEAFKLVTGSEENIQPVVTFTPDEGGVTVTYEFSGALQVEDELFPGKYSLSIPGFGSNMTSGEPAWISHWDTFEIPYQQDASIELLSSTETTFSMHLSPAREPLEDSGIETYSVDNVAPITPFNGWLPASVISNDGVQVYRDRNILYVGLSPIAYNMNEGKVRVVESLSYRVNFTNSKLKMVAKEQNALHSVDDDFMNSTFSFALGDSGYSTMDMALSDRPATRWTAGDGYLILSAPKYATAVNRFAAWKRQMGYNVTIVNKSSWTPATIKSEIGTKYDNNANLKYLLLFGDEKDLPAELVTIPGTVYNFYSDFRYACLDGDDDELQDLFMGRISVTNLSQAEVVVDKIIDYENKSNFTTKGLHCAEFSDYYPNDMYEDRRFVRTSEDIASGMESLGWNIERVYFYNNYHPFLCSKPQYSKPQYWNSGMYSYGERLPDFLLQDSFNWNGNAQNISKSINSGVQYVLHRDHGAIERWEQPSFSISDINALSNKSTMPIVFSMNCLTGMFQYTPYPQKYVAPADLNEFDQSTCFAEAFLRKSNGGCVGIFAASQISYSGYNDVLTMEMFQQIWPDSKFKYAFPNYSPIRGIGRKPIKRMGEVLNAGKLNLSQYYKPQEAYTKYTMYIFHWFGDPSMKIQTNKLMVSPNISITSSSPFQIPAASTFIVDTGVEVLLAKVDNTTSQVLNATGSRFSIPGSEFSKYKFYISADNIKPQELFKPTIILPLQEGEIMSANQEGDVLTVSYSIPESIENADISLKSVVTGYGKAVMCESDGQVTFDLSNNENGIYVIELRYDGVTIDTKKVIIK